MRSRTTFITATGLGLAAVIAVAGAAIWRSPGRSGPERTAQLNALDSPQLLLQVLVATFAIALVAGIVGAATSLVFPRAHRSRLSPLMVVALGLVTLGATAMVEWHTLGKVTFAPWLTVFGAGLALAVAAVVAIRQGGASRWLANVRGATRRGWRSLDLVVVATTVAVCVPVARFGLTAWTTTLHDWHLYSSSAMIAMEGEDAFSSRFQGGFGGNAIGRSGFEKTGMTGMISSVATVTGLEPFQLLTPLLIIGLAVLVAATAALIRRMWSLAPVTALLIALPVGLALPVVGRAFEAQLGGLVASALLATTIAVAATFHTHASRVRSAFVGVVTALLAVFAVACNSTVALSSLPVVALVVAWGWARNPPRRNPFLWYLFGAAVAGAGAFALLAGFFARSFSGQASVADSFPVLPLVTSAAAVGLEPPHPDLPHGIAAITWAVAFGVILMFAWTGQVQRRDRAWLTVLVVGCGLGGVALAMEFGADSYLTAKWVVAVIPIASPVVLAAGIAKLSPRIRTHSAVLTVGAAVAVTAGLFASCVGYGVSQVLPAGALAIRDSAALAQTPVVNVLTGDRHAAGFLPLLVPSARVVVVPLTYAVGESPVGSTFLVDDSALATGEWLSSESVTPWLYLAQRDTSGSLDLDFATDPAAGSTLSGAWNSREAGNAMFVVKDTGEEAFVTIFLPRPGDSDTLRVEIEGFAAGNGDTAPATQLTASIAGHDQTARAEFGEPIHIQLEVPAADIESDGTVVITFSVAGEPHQSAFRLDRARYSWIED